MAVQREDNLHSSETQSIVYAQDVLVVDHDPAIIHDAGRVSEMREHLHAGNVYVVRGVIPPETVARIRDYLTDIGRHSLPNYQRIEHGCPNFHRVNWWDPRAYVKGCFHQWSFFPWNQDMLDLFNLMRPGFRVKNLLNRLPMDKFLGMNPEEGCGARLSFQFYPRGIGGLNKHQDPVDHHQLTASLLIMSRKGEDFEKGGSYVQRADGEKVYLDDVAEPGDMVHTNALVPHGVERIDPDAEPDWLAFRGRWMMIFAVNHLANAEGPVTTSADMEDSEPASKGE